MNYSTGFWRFKEISVRLMKPSLAEIDVQEFLSCVRNWQPDFEYGDVIVFDGDIAQYLLSDSDSHHKFYAALVLGKPSLRCRMALEEPDDVLDRTGSKFRLTHFPAKLSDFDCELISQLKELLARKGYRFQSE